MKISQHESRSTTPVLDGTNANASVVNVDIEKLEEDKSNLKDPAATQSRVGSAAHNKGLTHQRTSTISPIANEDSENEEASKTPTTKKPNAATPEAAGDADIEQQVGKIVSKHVEAKGEILNQKMGIWRQEVDDLIKQRFNDINHCLLE